MKWGLFATSPALSMWHLVTPDNRSICGRTFRVEPEMTSRTKPDEIRGVCRRCEHIHSRDRLIARIHQNWLNPQIST